MSDEDGAGLGRVPSGTAGPDGLPARRQHGRPQRRTKPRRQGLDPCRHPAPRTVGTGAGDA